MSTKPKLRTRREIVLPAKTGSIVVTFRTRKHKGAIKNTRKVFVPRGAEQVNVRLKRGTTNGTRRTVAAPKKKTVNAKPNLPARSKANSAMKKPAAVAKITSVAKTLSVAKRQQFSEPLPAKVLRTMYACTVDKQDPRDGLKGIFYDSHNGNVVATDAHVLVCLPAQIKTERIEDKKGTFITANFPKYLAVIPPATDLSWTHISNIRTEAWAKQLKDAIARPPKGERTFVLYKNPISRYKLVLDAKILLKVLNFFAASGCDKFTTFSHDEARPLVLRNDANPGHLALVAPVGNVERFKRASVLSI
jgi:hypothetical protein